MPASNLDLKTDHRSLFLQPATKNQSLSSHVYTKSGAFRSMSTSVWTTTCPQRSQQRSQHLLHPLRHQMLREQGPRTHQRKTNQAKKRQKQSQLVKC
ncbi:hypothetical protein ACOMHN_049551 [Nucella lapillus]